MPHGGAPRTTSARFQPLRYSTTFPLSPAAPVSCGMNMNDLDGAGAGGGDEEAGSAAFGGLGGISGGIENLIALAIGNTRARVGLFEKGDLRDPVSITIGVAGSDSAAAPDPVTAAELVVAAVRRAGEAVHNAPVVVSSVNPAMADRICTALEGEGLDVYRVGVEGGDLPIPMAHALDDASTLGQDRLVCAFGAYRRSRQACVVIDAGTAITVDFVDGEGTFQGGLIAPGVAMMLRSLSENTAQLPRVALTRPDPSTPSASRRQAQSAASWARAVSSVTPSSDSPTPTARTRRSSQPAATPCSSSKTMTSSSTSSPICSSWACTKWPRPLWRTKTRPAHLLAARRWMRSAMVVMTT